MTIALYLSARARTIAGVLDNHVQAGNAGHDVTLDTPTVAEDSMMNTRLHVTITKDGAYYNNLAIYYNRNPIGEFLQFDPEFIPNTVADTHALLPLILDHYGVLLLPEDVVLEPVPAIGDVTITATADSLGWLGSHVFAEQAIVLRTVDNWLLQTSSGHYLGLYPGSYI